MNKITSLFNIEIPIIQAGMVWCSGWKLASAVSNAGALGLLGAGSMHPNIFKEHIVKCKKATSKPFGVNIPLLYPQVDELIDIVIAEDVKIVFTSAGNPDTWTSHLKNHGIKVVHVIANKKFALKAESSGVDAIVAEGFEAGGHNGREETTTMCLVPMICDTVRIPVIAAGGIADGRGMLAAMALGADAVQIGSRFAAATESSAHVSFKNEILNAAEGSTKLSMKQLLPVRLLKNEFFRKVEQIELNGGSREDLVQLLGTGRAKKGMFEGELAEGELEIGQAAMMIDKIEPAMQIVHEIWEEFIRLKGQLSAMDVNPRSEK